MTFGLHQLGEYFGFEYSPFLHYLHESSLRNYSYWGLDCDALLLNTLDEKDISESLSIGKIHPHVYLQEIGEINGINVGFGVFAARSIPCHEFIGEYVGVVMESSTAISSCSYSLNYPSADKSYVVSAKEIGKSDTLRKIILLHRMHPFNLLCLRESFTFFV